MTLSIKHPDLDFSTTLVMAATAGVPSLSGLIHVSALPILD